MNNDERYELIKKEFIIFNTKLFITVRILPTVKNIADYVIDDVILTKEI
jgi:hypothetical protein